MIRKAAQIDMNAIMVMIKRVVEVMNAQGSQQWDESYPSQADYQKDLKRGELYVLENQDIIRGVCTISKRGHQEYHLINWSHDEPAWTIKRIAIDPDYRGQGAADQFLAFAEQLAVDSGVNYLTTDTYSENEYAQRLFKRHGFQFVEVREYENEQLVYFEKKLTRSELANEWI
ncbi:GNAT family N-acetyltransferase [Amphibacillus sediminis]|uniref:GNAT family N-acetyltransferase n=1 Tax=Amphibacillus sediminis TaxID=360185 RepID=UPI0008296A31|nr:GNAT family N-acetyltransferase [Amphibacillus sediminis]